MTNKAWLACAWSAVAVSLLMLAGCQTTTTTGPYPPNRQLIPPGSDNTSGTAIHEDADPMADSDPCAVRLHNVEGTLLFYYALNKQMPNQLADLQTVTDIDTPLKLTCPLSDESYSYYPRGLVTPTKQQMIVICDPDPSHHGGRWCVLMSPIVPGQALSTDVQWIPEKVFQTYAPAAQ